jgi:hypothetical protein
MHHPKKPAASAESSAPTPEPHNGGFGATVTDGATLPGDIVVADGLPLERLYARFDAIARGRAPGNSSATHQSVLERLASNQQRAEALGWSEFVLERLGGSGRLVLRGNPPIGPDRELVPDAIPYDGAAPADASSGARELPRDADGRIGADLTNLSWRSRIGWLDDGGR